jgi:adenylate cyclase
MAAFPLRLGRTARGAMVGSLCGLLSWAVALLPFFRGMEDWLQDAYFAYRGPRVSTAHVVVVGIDDATLRALDKPLASISPELGEVVTYLRARGATAIGLDLMIPETLDRYDVARGLDGKALGLAAGRAGNVVLPLMIGDAGQPVLPLHTWQTGAPLALVELSPDADHLVRRQQLAGLVGSRAYDQFALSLLNVSDLAGVDSRGTPHADFQAVPLDDRGRLRINFVGPPGTLPHLSFAQVLAAARRVGPPPVDQRGRPAEIDGAIVIVGATAHSLGDYHATPYANGTLLTFWQRRPRLMSGPEVQANLVATMVDGAYITTPWWLSSLPQVLVLGASLGWAFARMTLWQGFALAFAHHWLWKGIALFAFWYGNWRVETGVMLMTGVACYGATFAFRWMWLRKRMYGMVKGDVLARLMEDEASHPGLNGEEREVTVLFADIRGFTRYSHAHSAREVVELLNAYLEEVVPIVERHGGMVDKYIGDGVMALFGAPDDRPDHVERAVRAAVEMVERTHELRKKWVKHDFSDFRIGVGIQTGPALVGTVGSRRRLDYTAIGDTVNTAARIESANKEHRSEILIGARTYGALDSGMRRRLGCADMPASAMAHGLTGLVVYRVDVGDGRREDLPIG